MRLLDRESLLAGFPGCPRNSPQWRLTAPDAEGPAGARPCLGLLENTSEDHERGTVLLVGDPAWTDYAVEAQVRAVASRMPNGVQSWIGLALRAQDVDNDECVWLTHRPDGTARAAYVAVAHGLQPWWSEGYTRQAFGEAAAAFGTWVHLRAETRGRELRLQANGAEVLRTPRTYYLWRGRPGLYVGTGTDAFFRDVRADALAEPPSTLPRRRAPSYERDFP